MSEEKKSEVARKLELLKLRFREKATKDIDLLQVAAGRFRVGDCATEDIATMHHSLHRLAGSAGTFGFSRLGEEARSLEILLKPLTGGDDHQPVAADSEQVRRVVNHEFVSRIGSLTAEGLVRSPRSCLRATSRPKVRSRAR